MRVYYNEFDPKAAAWLRELIEWCLLPKGTVDERSIVDVQPSDLEGFDQCHFFAGIGGWLLALRIATAHQVKDLWTASCPCQPLSCAGKLEGHADPRHLWPAFYKLYAKRNPAIIFGEQVASPDGIEWLSGIRADLEGSGYAFGAADLCCPSVGETCREGVEGAAYLRSLVNARHPATKGRETEILSAARELEGLVSGAPHIRQRLFWGAIRLGNTKYDARGTDLPRWKSEIRAVAWGNGSTVRMADSQHTPDRSERDSEAGLGEPWSNGASGGMADSQGGGLGANRGTPRTARHVDECGKDGIGMGDTIKPGLEGYTGHGNDRDKPGRKRKKPARSVTETSSVGRVEEPKRDESAGSPGNGAGSNQASRAGAPGQPAGSGATCRVSEPDSNGREPGEPSGEGDCDWSSLITSCGPAEWAGSDWHYCRDEKIRRIPANSQPVFQCMVDGVPTGLDACGSASYGFPLASKEIPGRAALLKGYGNAINPHVAAKFIQAFLEVVIEK